MKALAFIVLMTAAPAFAAGGVSPYAGQEDRDLKALDREFVQGLRAGAGLGFAKPAELNGYPGPAHLLEDKSEIPLSPRQIEAIHDIFERMRADAIRLGEALIAAEIDLEMAFRNGHIDQDQLSALTTTAGRARADVRARHLAAHLEAKALLRPEQIHRYNALRGYGMPHGHGGHGGGHKH